ncbi:MAG: hypothetical protein P9M03_05735 [Candidatus Theseobacter exili]|nr:hypothetical protein [Candidatus Theseobacter exili]
MPEKLTSVYLMSTLRTFMLTAMEFMWMKHQQKTGWKVSRMYSTHTNT